MPVFRNKDEARPIIALGRRAEHYTLCSDSDEDFEEINFEKAILERQCLYEPSRTKRQRTVKKLLFCLLVLVFLAILVSLFYYYFSRQSLQRWRRIEMEELRVEIDGGYVNGVLEDEVFVFKGIPYGVPPIGTSRWKYPEHCSLNRCWNGTFKASQYGHRCTQAKFDNRGSIRRIVGHEDCLFINVWSPTTSYADKNLPVVVYIHGGGLIASSGNEAGLHPTPDLVKQMQVVGVSFNYRLNAFGFLALDALSLNSNHNTSGNYGFMDQILALKWIQNNIGKFGGDRNKVTLLGQGSGGTSILALTASPLAKGLFHRAILMSPSSDIMVTTAEASRNNKLFLKNTNCSGNHADQLKCLANLSKEEIINAIPWNTGLSIKDRYDLPIKGMYDKPWAVIDGYVIPRSPIVSMATGHSNEVSLVIGSTAQEIGINPSKSFMDSTILALKNYTRDKLTPFFNGNVSKHFLEKIYDLYNFNSYNDTSAQYLYLTLASDIREVCPVEYLAITASKHFHHTHVYRYVVTNIPSHHVTLPMSQGYDGPQYAFHMWDLIAFFEYPKPFKYKPTGNDNFSQLLQEEFQQFIYYGKVKNTNWKNHSSHSNNTAIFGQKGLNISPNVYHRKQCLFWLSHGFANYAWIN